MITTRRWIGMSVALVLLNTSVTFTNVWPTLGIRLTRDVSLELAIVALGLVLVWSWRALRSPSMSRWLAIFWVILVIGRYAEVTARSLYGQDINLFWDLRHMPNVGAIFSAVADPWMRITVIGGVVVIPLLMYAGARWALGCLVDAANDRRARHVLGVTACALLVLAGSRGVGVSMPESIRFSEPVVPAYARELSELAYEMTGAGVRSLAPQPVLDSNLARVDGADVFVIFLESYGAVSWERPEFVNALAESRRRLMTDIRETGRSVVSARVESTTFGGESWLAHLSLLSGTEVRDPGTHKRLMAQDRDTLVKVFGRSGYRTVALSPGLQHSWPQGKFYGFEQIYGLAQLDYQGPSFGWWDLNDQFSLARMDELEVARQPRRPLFVFFPTITTHVPFVPTPPYQPDWSRILTVSPYDAKDLDQAWSDYPDWMNLGPSYVKALSYAYATIGGYLRLRADRDFVVLLIGDHQPPSLVSGDGATWDVPVHVIANRRAVLDRLLHHRFVARLALPELAVARMDTLLPILLDAFGDGAHPGPKDEASALADVIVPVALGTGFNIRRRAYAYNTHLTLDHWLVEAFFAGALNSSGRACRSPHAGVAALGRWLRGRSAG